jgi:hypothetical protein
VLGSFAYTRDPGAYAGGDEVAKTLPRALGEALRENGRTDEAKAARGKIMAAPPSPDRQFESAQWKAEAQKLLHSLSKP